MTVLLLLLACPADPPATPKARVTLTSLVVTGNLSYQLGREVMEAHMPAWEACALDAPDACGRIHFEVGISRHGNRHFRVLETPTTGSEFTSCVARDVQDLRPPTMQHAVPGVTWDVTLDAMDDCPSEDKQ
jgi:hypothetical protein